MEVTGTGLNLLLAMQCRSMLQRLMNYCRSAVIHMVPYWMCE